MSAAPERRSLLPLWAALAVVAARLPVLLAHQDSHYPFELFSGNVAAALLDGLQLDLSRLTIIPHIRGGPVFGLLGTPLFALFGETLLVLKLVPLAWHALSVALMVALLARHGGRSAAWAGLGLALCAPPLLAKLSVLGLASHLEALLPALLALLAWSSIVQGQRTARSAWVRLGLAVGFCSFFHLQALLLCLILLALLLLRYPQRLLSGSLPLLLGLALTASPQLLFEGQDLSLGQSVMGKTPHQSVANTSSGPIGEVALFERPAKALLMATAGMAPMLEYAAEPHWARVGLSHAWWFALLLAAGRGAWRSRQSLLNLLRQPFASDGTAPDLGCVLALHALAVAVLFVASGVQANLWFVGTGMASRRLIPMLMSLLMLAALGCARRGSDSARSDLVRRATLGVLLLCGALGSLQAGSSDGAARLPHRGEHYEWFVPQLDHHVEGDAEQLVELVRRVDRGDPRFASLRYPLRCFELSSQQPLLLQLARARAALPATTAPLFAVTALGRAWGQDDRLLQMLARDELLSTFTQLERSAFLHGVGLGLSASWPRASASDSPGTIHPVLPYLARELPDAPRAAIFEGLGFSRGQVYDPYNHYMARELGELSQLAEPMRSDLLRGFGWGYRQRYVTPPTQLPAGLSVLSRIAQSDQPSFLEGLLGRSLPEEAATLAR